MKNLKKTLSQAGYRLSEPRRRVMQLLENSEKPLAPLAIYRALKETGCKLGMVSVYRALSLLTNLGLVSMVYKADGSAGYVSATRGHHHYIICQKCHKVLEFAGSEDLESLISRVQAETHFVVADHLLQLYGICPECQLEHGNGDA